MMSQHSRRELFDAVLVRYHCSNKVDKGVILDEFIHNTGLNRKYVICVLGKIDESTFAVSSVPARTRLRPCVYGPDVAHALLWLWQQSGGLCPKRLVPFLAEFMEALERFDELDVCPQVRVKLLAMSVSTAERLLSHSRRSHERGISTTLPGVLLRQQIPIHTFTDWTRERPGLFEIDLVAHCGGTAAGEYLYTLTMTDVCTGWTELVALVNRSQAAVQAGIDQVRRRLPFRLLGIDSDNGAEFINHCLKRYCDEHGISFTRCRPYKKNDQCHVEQKNGAVVRPLVGYARYEGPVAAAYLNRLYRVHHSSLNFFQPSMKLIGKNRDAARVRKTYDTAQTPWRRLLSAGVLSQDDKEKLEALYLAMNPAKLHRDIEELETGLHRFAVGPPVAADVPATQPTGSRDATTDGGDNDASVA
jgi:hypothetical protein